MTDNKLSIERMLRPVNHAVGGFEKKHGSSVVCPICSFEYVHINTGEVRAEDYTGNNQALIIPMFCEEGHRWDLIIDQYKGWCFISIINPRKIEPVEEGEWK